MTIFGVNSESSFLCLVFWTIGLVGRNNCFNENAAESSEDSSMRVKCGGFVGLRDSFLHFSVLAHSRGILLWSICSDVVRLMQFHQSVVQGKGKLPDELLYGRVGYLYSLIFINQQFQQEKIPIQYIQQVSGKHVIHPHLYKTKYIIFCFTGKCKCGLLWFIIWPVSDPSVCVYCRSVMLFWHLGRPCLSGTGFRNKAH